MAHRRHARRAVGLGLIGDGIRRLRRARFFLLRELLADYGAWYTILVSVLTVVTMMRYPQGLWGLLAER